MRLRTGLALAMLACGLTPLVVAGALARGVLTRRYEAEDARRREAAITGVEGTLERQAEAQGRLLARFCAHDPLVDQTLVKLATGRFDREARDELNAPGGVLQDVRNALGFDVLEMVRSDGEILASAHYPGQAGSRDVETFRLAERARGNERWLVPVRVRDRDGPRNRLVLESFCVKRLGTVAVAVAGGRALDDGTLLRDANAGEGVTARLVEGPARPDTGTAIARVLPLRGPGGEPVASVVVTTSDAALRELVRGLDTVTAAGAIFALVTALLLAVLLATPLARPIGEVADAADRIAQGDRRVQIGVRAGGEVGRLVAAFNHMTQELDAAEGRLRKAERVAAWRDIARQMAHEIKNPLTPIRMAVEMLRKARERGLEDFDTLFEEETRIVLDEVERLRRLVENFSQFARAPRPRVEAVAVGDVVAYVADLHAGGAVTITPSVDEDVEAIQADRDQLTQVLVNLVANGCHAAEERAQTERVRGESGRGAPWVTVRVRTSGPGMVRITVGDNGAGIPPAVMARLFEPYVTSKAGGTGLGLAIAYRIVTDHGGTIAVDTGPMGTRFTVDLPVAGPPEGAVETEEGA